MREDPDPDITLRPEAPLPDGEDVPAEEGRAGHQPEPAEDEPPAHQPQPAAPGRAPASASTMVPPVVRGAAAWSWRIIVIIVAAGVIILGMIQLKTVVVPVMVAALLTSLLSYPVGWLQAKTRLPRTLAVIVVLLLVAGVISGLLLLVGASIAQGFSDLADRATAGFDSAVGWLSSGPLQLDQSQITSWTQEGLEQLRKNADGIVSGALTVTTSLGHVAAGALIALFCLFFFLKEGRSMWTWVVGLFPAGVRERVDGAALRSWVSLTNYTRTQIVVAFVDGLGIGLWAWLWGVPLPVPLAVLVFLGSFIPIIGAVVTGAVAVAVALVDQGFGTAAIMLGGVLLVQQTESHLLQPALMSKALRLHPVAVLLAVATGSLVGGIVGALFAVPLVAMINTTISYLTGHDMIPPANRRAFSDATTRWRRA